MVLFKSEKQQKCFEKINEIERTHFIEDELKAKGLATSIKRNIIIDLKTEVNSGHLNVVDIEERIVELVESCYQRDKVSCDRNIEINKHIFD